MRPLTNMSAKVNPNTTVFPFQPTSLNQKLENLKSVLSYECKKSPELLGGAIWDYGDLVEKLRSFKEKHSRDTRPLFVVRLDLANCYDRIHQDKVLEIVEEVYFTWIYYVLDSKILKMHSEIFAIPSLRVSPRFQETWEHCKFYN